jgi:hypothetical protein
VEFKHIRDHTNVPESRTKLEVPTGPPGGTSSGLRQRMPTQAGKYCKSRINTNEGNRKSVAAGTSNGDKSLGGAEHEDVPTSSTENLWRCIKIKEAWVGGTEKN